MVPAAVVSLAMGWLDRAAIGLIAVGVTANGITLFSVVLAAAAGALLALGFFGAAAVAMVVASLGDALDGLVARRTGTASVGGALLDASADRYEEFFFLGGLALYFHETPAMLGLTLMALAGSFMVSYGSAKAEAMGMPVPPSSMRRAERAVCLCLGAMMTPPIEWVTRTQGLPPWVGKVPLLVALGVIAVVANVSAIRRLRGLALRHVSVTSPTAAADGASAPSRVAPDGRMGPGRRVRATPSAQVSVPGRPGSHR
jgi:CDP-diacylglycerol--glycerol-3-phosphate 3-phosphatidyltransferase